MKKNTSTVAATTVAIASLLSLPASAQALELHVSDRGVVSFYEDGVLGETSDQPAAQRERQATKVVPATRDKRVEIKAKDDMVEVRVDKATMPVEELGQAAPVTEDSKDVIEAKRLRAQFNTQRAKDTLKPAETATRPAKRPLTKPEREYFTKLDDDRRTNEDALEVKSQLDAEGDQTLELQNNAVRARLRGADFTFNPETNTVTLVTPSGNEHELKHLPDQALERINAVVSLEKTDPAVPDVSIESNEQGTVYRTKGTRRKKLFGLFNRDIQTEVVLDDETGEVATMDQPSAGILGKLLDAFSI